MLSNSAYAVATAVVWAAVHFAPSPANPSTPSVQPHDKPSLTAPVSERNLSHFRDWLRSHPQPTTSDCRIDHGHFGEYTCRPRVRAKDAQGLH
jgi:hypothetical protein